ncbi:hypothetical protein BDZ88DRAFT_410848 [Geranomyces variabilis]|nr:hypothetical protein BDZ88DRAFT_410848 [Geranomyces variabilis]
MSNEHALMLVCVVIAYYAGCLAVGQHEPLCPPSNDVTNELQNADPQARDVSPPHHGFLNLSFLHCTAALYIIQKSLFPPSPSRAPVVYCL